MKRKSKSDQDIQRDVSAELRWDPSLNEEEIAVGVRDGVVTLGGFVDSYAQKLAAEQATRRVEGVRGISEQIEVRLPSGVGRTDTELAHRAVDALRWDTEVPSDNVTAKVENGWVTLEGEVDWGYQRTAAERAVRYLFGVTGVSNRITVKARVAIRNVADRITEALKRHAEKEAAAIRVAAKDTVVTLEGSVDTWADRYEVERAAWSAPGVTAVDDRLTVGG